MKYTLLLVALLLAGCGHKPSGTSVQMTISEHLQLPNLTITATHELTGAEKVILLRQRAKVSGLYWYIFCIPKEDGTEYYEANAFQNGSMDYGEFQYYEDGVRNWWSASGDTIGDAAYALYRKIQGPPNQVVEHRPPPSSKKKSNCDYNTVLDSRHATKKPCGKDRE